MQNILVWDFAEDLPNPFLKGVQLLCGEIQEQKDKSVQVTDTFPKRLRQETRYKDIMPQLLGISLLSVYGSVTFYSN